MPQETLWLVEIRLKDWIPTPTDGSRILGYEEVRAFSEIAARYTGFDQFLARSRHEPNLRRKLDSLGITQGMYCAPDAVEIG